MHCRAINALHGGYNRLYSVNNGTQPGFGDALSLSTCIADKTGLFGQPEHLKCTALVVNNTNVCTSADLECKLRSTGI